MGLSKEEGALLIKAAREAIEHYFEYPIQTGDWSYDLLIPAIFTLFEFDGNHHKGADQREKDGWKNTCAILHGFRVIRLPDVVAGKSLDPHIIDDYIRPLINLTRPNICVG